MSRCPKNPLRPLLEEEREQLMHWSRGRAIAASQVARAKALLAVAEGRSYTEAAREVGRPKGDAVATLVSTFQCQRFSGGDADATGVGIHECIQWRNGNGF